ncbi:pheromone A receptor-domain-containing protein [Hysterangium stoloniferum]|nr:pheromone A receptor-domain-containing protein [Hysterangium stoloniferum]
MAWISFERCGGGYTPVLRPWRRTGKGVLLSIWLKNYMIAIDFEVPKSRSIPIISLVAWMTVMNIIHGVDSLAWANNVDIKLERIPILHSSHQFNGAPAPATKIEIGYTFAVPAAGLCLMRHLESVAAARQFSWCSVRSLPCEAYDVTYTSPQILSSKAIDSILSRTSVAVRPFTAFTLRHFLRHRISFATHLRNSQSAISPNRYFRLMALAVVEMTWDIGINVYLLTANFSMATLLPWINWQNVHAHFSRVQQLPKFLVTASFMNQEILVWWFVPFTCVLFFLFFAFGEEAMSDYRACFSWFRRTILRQRVEKPKNRGEILPSYRHDIHINTNKRDLAGDDTKAPWDSCSISLPDLTTPSELAFASDMKAPQLHGELDLTVDGSHIVSVPPPTTLNTDCPSSLEHSASEQNATLPTNEPDSNNSIPGPELTTPHTGDGIRVTIERTVSVSRRL